MTETPPRDLDNGWTLSPTARRNIRRTILFIVSAVVLYYFALPRLAGGREAVDLMSQVKPAYLVLGLGLEFAALIAYAQLTRSVLPPGSIGLFRMVRIQLATKSLTNVVPGGSAAGSALGYRLLVTSGVDTAHAGFAVASVGLASALVLNFILWIALLVSIPFYGLNGGYLTAAIAGAFLMGFVAFLVLALMRGRHRAHQMVAWLTKHLRFIDGPRVSAFIERFAARLAEMRREPKVLREAAAWATLNWLLDAAALGVFLQAYGESPGVIGLLIAFGLANVAAALPITPGGLGIVESVLIPTLVGFGVSRATATVGVATYRLATWLLPIPLGALAYLTVRKDLRDQPFRRVAEEAYETPESRLEWAERYGTQERQAPASAGGGGTPGAPPT